MTPDFSPMRSATPTTTRHSSCIWYPSSAWSFSSSLLSSARGFTTKCISYITTWPSPWCWPWCSTLRRWKRTRTRWDMKSSAWVLQIMIFSDHLHDHIRFRSIFVHGGLRLVRFGGALRFPRRGLWSIGRCPFQLYASRMGIARRSGDGLRFDQSRLIRFRKALFWIPKPGFP